MAKAALWPRVWAGVVGSVAACATFHPFRAEIGRMDVDGQLVQAPYLATHRYYGFLAAVPDRSAARRTDGAAAPAPAQDAGDREASPFVYLWLPTAQPELGVRVVSPSEHLPPPRAHVDTVEAAWRTHGADAGFDACVAVERCLVLRDPGRTEAQCERWLPLGTNEDSPEAPFGSGTATNALVRVLSNDEEPLYALVRGLYRLQVARCRDDAAAHGPFVVEVGAPMSLEGVAMARHEASLAQEARALGEHVPLLAQPARDGFVGAPGEGPYVAPLPDSLAPAQGHSE